MDCRGCCLPMKPRRARPNATAIEKLIVEIEKIKSMPDEIAKGPPRDSSKVPQVGARDSAIPES